MVLLHNKKLICPLNINEYMSYRLIDFSQNKCHVQYGSILSKHLYHIPYRVLFGVTQEQFGLENAKLKRRVGA